MAPQAVGANAVGVVRTVSPDVLEVVDDDQRLHTFVRQGIVSLEVSEAREVRGGRKNLAAAAFIGVMAAGAGIGAATWSPCTDTGWFSCFMHPGSRGVAAGLGALLALPVGIAASHVLGSDRVSDVWVGGVLPGADGSVGGPELLLRPAGPTAWAIGLQIPTRW